MSNISNGKSMFIVGALTLLLAVAFASASWFTVIAFRGTEGFIFQSLRFIGLLLSITSLVFFAKGLKRTFPEGKKTKSGIMIMVVGAVVLVAGLWITMGSLFNLWGLNNLRGFTAMFSVALVLFVLSLGLGYWGYCRATFVEKKYKSMGRIIVAQAH